MNAALVAEQQEELLIGELFAGYHGLGMGVQLALGGGTVVWHSEVDQGALKVLRHRLPNALDLGDVREIDWTEVPRVHVVCAGFPCQDVSHAGRRAGLVHGTRTGLWHEVVRAIRELQPPLVVLENVRGLLSARGDEPSADLENAWARTALADRLLASVNQRIARAKNEGRTADAQRLGARRVRILGLRKRAVADARRADRLIIRAIGTVLGDLADLGYDARWYCIRASDVGAPHGRLRVFIGAWPAVAADPGGEVGEQRPGLRADAPTGFGGGTACTRRSAD